MENFILNSKNESYKKNLNFIFTENPILEKIGSLNNYAEYISTIFPNSKYKDIFFHGSKSKNIFEKKDWNIDFDNNSSKNLGKGYYFTLDKDKAESYSGREGGTLIKCILNIEKPIFTDITRNSNKGLSYAGDLTTKELADISGGGDSVIAIEYADKDNYEKINDYLEIYKGPLDEKGFPARQEFYMRVPEIKELSLVGNSQIHILGSKEDIDMFTSFMKNKKNNQDEKYLV